MTTVAAWTTPVTSRPRRSRVARGSLWVLQVVLTVIYVFSGIMKVSLDPATMVGFTAMGFSAAGCVTIGVLELLGATALLIPRLAGLAATALTVLMIGATTAMASIGAGPFVLIPATVLVLVAIVALLRRHETASLIRTAWTPLRARVRRTG